ncbi:glycosyltransferase family 4 protein [Patescibacteria group bacterium]|nr:glycosyltransferase family 4 protein [Patescibacteria group bacterium]
MKLLMITRKVDRDDAQAGFTYGWVKKMGQQVDVLKVICLEKGNTKGLSNNVEVFSLGKENGKNKLREFINFYRGAFKFIGKVDGVFCHQNPEYTILIGPLAKLRRKKIVSWYSHKAINWRVKLMAFFAEKIITPTQEGFGLKSDKKVVVGHGIDTELFKPAEQKNKNDIFRVISVGRISPIKNYETLIEAIEIIRDKIDIKVDIIGGPGIKKQEIYFDKLKWMVKNKGLDKVIRFKGLIPNQELPRYYQESDLSINLCPTGSPDKAVLESMASGLPVLVCNKTFASDLGPFVDKMLFKEKDAKDLSQKILKLINSNQLKGIGLFLREQVVKNHNLDNLIGRIIKLYK